METLNEMLADPAVLLVSARDDDGICTVVTFATTPYCAEYHLNVSVRNGKCFTAPLIWWGVPAAGDHGHSLVEPWRRRLAERHLGQGAGFRIR